MVDLNDQGLRRQNALNDITETTGLVFLGLTIGCARCHDHKFDPIRQADFYRLQAFFTPARFRDDYPARLAGGAQGATSRPSPPGRRGRRGPGRDPRASRSPIRDRLAPGLPMGALDDGRGRLQQARVRARLRPRSSSSTSLLSHGPADQGRATGRGCSVRRHGVPASALLARLDADREAPRRRPLPTARGIDEAGREAPPTYFLPPGRVHRARAGRRARVPGRPRQSVAPAEPIARRPSRPAAARRWPTG